MIWLLACTPNLRGHEAECGGRRPDCSTSSSTSPPPPPTTDTGSDQLPACDLPDVPQGPTAPDIYRGVDFADIVGSDPFSRLGYAVDDVTPPGQAATLVLGAPQVPGVATYYDLGEQQPPSVWVFDGPLPAGHLGRPNARSVLVGNPNRGVTARMDGWVLASGDLTGDGVPEFVTGGEWTTDNPFFVVTIPTPPGESYLDAVAYATYKRPFGAHIKRPSVGDWDLDGVGELALGVAGAGSFSYGAEVFVPSPGATKKIGDPDHDGAIAWFEAREYNLASLTGRNSTLIPDVTGDGAADLLVSGDGWELLYYDGNSPFYAGGLALFAGNVTGGHDLDDALQILYGPCDPGLQEPQPVGDIAGDARPDVAIRGPYAMVGGVQRGAVWILSRLGPADGWQSLTMASDVVIVGHEGQYLADVAPLGDLDGDGHDDLVVLTDVSMSIFLGPLEGFLDLWDADLSIAGGVVYGNGRVHAADVTGDGVNDIIVGDPIRGWSQEGEVRVYDGAEVRAILP